MTDQTPDPRFTYQDITPPAIKQEMVDTMANAVLDPNAAELGYVGAAEIALKAAFCVAYMIIWEKLTAAKQLIAKQKYEAGLAAANQQELDGDVMPLPKK